MDENTEGFWQRNINKLTISIMKSLLDENGVAYQKNEKKPKLLEMLISLILSKKILNCNENIIKEMKIPEDVKRKFLNFPEQKETSELIAEIKTETSKVIDLEDQKEIIDVEEIEIKETKKEEKIKQTFLTQIFETNPEIPPVKEPEEKKNEIIETKSIETIEMNKLEKIGFVKSIINEKTLIIQSDKDSIPLKETSKFYTNEAHLIGQISLVFGPRETPLYKIENPKSKVSIDDIIFYDIDNCKKFEEDELYSSESEVDLSDNEDNQIHGDFENLMEEEEEEEVESSSEDSSEDDSEVASGDESDESEDDDEKEDKSNDITKKRKNSFDEESENKKMIKETNFDEDALLAELFETPMVYENENQE